MGGANRFIDTYKHLDGVCAALNGSKRDPSRSLAHFPSISSFFSPSGGCDQCVDPVQRWISDTLGCV